MITKIFNHKEWYNFMGEKINHEEKVCKIISILIEDCADFKSMSGKILIRQVARIHSTRVIRTIITICGLYE